MAYISPFEIIFAQKTTELVFLFHKNITKLGFLWLNMSPKSFKVLISFKFRACKCISMCVIVDSHGIH